MTQADEREILGFIGGTGPQGRGLAARWSRAGHEVWLGSRSIGRATEIVEGLQERVGADAALHPATNLEAVEHADIVVVAVPFEAQQTVLPPLREAVGGKVVLNVVNPMVFDDRGPKAVRVEAGSSGEECAEIWPEARVVSAFHDVSSRRLLRVDEPIVTHVLICSDDEAAAHLVSHLAARIDGMWGVYCGPLRMSEYVENITPLLLTINKIYKTQAGLLIDGIERDGSSLHAHETSSQ